MGEEAHRLGARYRLETLLRHGTSIRTWAGVDEASGAPVVVKELRIPGLASWKELDLFEREATTLAALHHPGIPRLIDHFVRESEGSAYLVMERMPGEPLSRRIERGAPCEAAEVRRILEALLEILVYLHGLAPPVIHRDLKPANVLVGPERISLVDFGGVRPFLPWADPGSTLVGTFGYLAPEQLHGAATPASDLYALGVTAAALLAGCEGHALPRRGLRLDLGAIPAARPPLATLLSRLTDPDPEARLGSAAEALAALRAASGDAALAGALAPVGVAAGSLGAAPPRPPSLRRAALRWGLVVAGGASLLTGLTIAALRFFTFPEPLSDPAVLLAGLGLLGLGGALLLRSRKGRERAGAPAPRAGAEKRGG